MRGTQLTYKEVSLLREVSSLREGFLVERGLLTIVKINKSVSFQQRGVIGEEFLSFSGLINFVDLHFLGLLMCRLGLINL